MKRKMPKLNTREGGYAIAPPKVPSKRFCLAVDLKPDSAGIKKYLHYHSRKGVWMEIVEGIRKAGIPVMDIYRADNRLFMICEVPRRVDLDAAFKKMGTFERQDEWGKIMTGLQQALPGHKLEWVKLERVFQLYK